MPIPDAVAPDDDYREQQRRAEEAQNAETLRIFAACNALLARQQVCGKCCHWCSEKCKELQAWLDVGEK